MTVYDGFESPSVKQNQVQYNIMLGYCQNSIVEHHVKDETKKEKTKKLGAQRGRAVGSGQQRRRRR